MVTASLYKEGSYQCLPQVGCPSCLLTYYFPNFPSNLLLVADKNEENERSDTQRRQVAVQRQYGIAASEYTAHLADGVGTRRSIDIGNWAGSHQQVLQVCCAQIHRPRGRIAPRVQSSRPSPCHVPDGFALLIRADGVPRNSRWYHQSQVKNGVLYIDGGQASFSDRSQFPNVSGFNH